mmetsp:Transcript_23157/g.30674  ORF Transcript_23157/g.30674 Transcript_23157/m.30674 type:complete len:84 (+) Transcript_23157:320-571(+)
MDLHDSNRLAEVLGERTCDPFFTETSPDGGSVLHKDVHLSPKLGESLWQQEAISCPLLWVRPQHRDQGFSPAGDIGFYIFTLF